MSRAALFLDVLAATLFGGCVAASLIIAETHPLAAGGIALLVALLARGALARIDTGDERADFLPVEPAFDPVPDEDDILLLEDRLVGVDSGSNVVRLFGSGRLPGAAPGELAGRIEDFLDARRVASGDPPPPTDAAQELYDALLAIRQTIRN